MGSWKLWAAVGAGLLALGGIAWAASRTKPKEAKTANKKKSIKKAAKSVVKKAMKKPVVVTAMKDLKAALQTAANEVKA